MTSPLCTTLPMGWHTSGDLSLGAGSHCSSLWQCLTEVFTLPRGTSRKVPGSLGRSDSSKVPPCTMAAEQCQLCF